MANKKVSIPVKVQKLIFKEADNKCAFCSMEDIHVLEIHHIRSREDGGGDEPENLILVCSNCHSQITYEVISMVDVVTKKRELIYTKPKERVQSSLSNAVNISGNVKDSIVANVVRISNVKRSENKYPEGSVGADLMKKNYLDYLIHKYFDFRKADPSFGAFTHAEKFHYAELHESIRKRFKAKTFYVPAHRFQDECQYIQGRINKTILGKRNKKQGISSYKSFEEYIKEQGLR
ncbi:MAG: HNH endonuclease [Deltaproteobacteria bacterium]|nr:HNH endonuclease [Deltaproteobacteria bacterium]